MGIGANQTAVDEHAQIYSQHIEFLNYITYLPFSLYGSIDALVTEYLEPGETIMRSPRMCTYVGKESTTFRQHKLGS
jgi:hypothetical protein